MRHRNLGRKLGRSPSHRRAMLRNLASSLFLTERDAEFDENAPKVKGRVTTTLHKAKEARRLVERCITIARRALKHLDAAEEFATDAERGSDQWRKWRYGAKAEKGADGKNNFGEEWRKWADAVAPALAARRRALQLLGDKEAVEILFEEIAPRFRDRDGGYTRVLKLAKPRLGDAGVQAILEFVGVHDRVIEKSEKPAFADDDEEDLREEEAAAEEESAEEEPAAEEQSGDEAEASSEEESGDEGEEEKKDDA